MGQLSAKNCRPVFRSLKRGIFLGSDIVRTLLVIFYLVCHRAHALLGARAGGGRGRHGLSAFPAPFLIFFRFLLPSVCAHWRELEREREQEVTPGWPPRRPFPFLLRVLAVHLKVQVCDSGPPAGTSDRALCHVASSLTSAPAAVLPGSFKGRKSHFLGEKVHDLGPLSFFVCEVIVKNYTIWKLSLSKFTFNQLSVLGFSF